MQGRLLPPINNTIQSFPKDSWQMEFPLAQELNLDCIEFIFDGKNYASHPLMTPSGLKEIQKLEQENNIQVLSVCADFFMIHPIHRGNTEKKATNLQILKDLIIYCSGLEVRDIVIPCVDNSKLHNDTDLQVFKSGINECLSLAEECNLNLTLETDLDPADFTQLLQDFNSDNLKINYDTGNSASIGYNPEVELHSYGKWITDVHIKDRVFGGSTVPLGEGDANFSLIFASLQKLNYQGIFILQTARKETGEEKATIKEYLDFIHKYHLGKI